MLTNLVNTARLVRVTASVPEICMHNVRLGQGCFCPHCPTASYDPCPPGQLPHLGGEGYKKAGPSLEPRAPLATSCDRVSDLRLEEIRRSFIMALDKGDPNYMVSLEWNEGLSILNELMFKRVSENRDGEHGR